jgi:excinuclease ABC subunit A
MGPEGGEEGGVIMATGTPEEVAAVDASYTGRFLREMVTPKAPRKRAPRSGDDGSRRKVAAAA